MFHTYTTGMLRNSAIDAWLGPSLTHSPLTMYLLSIIYRSIYLSIYLSCPTDARLKMARSGVRFPLGSNRGEVPSVRPSIHPYVCVL